MAARCRSQASCIPDVVGRRAISVRFVRMPAGLFPVQDWSEGYLRVCECTRIPIVGVGMKARDAVGKFARKSHSSVSPNALHVVESLPGHKRCEGYPVPNFKGPS